ncbi:hypothetical protein BJ508DRAFT_363357 [Ascobolus immersus RN42]|uniref:Small ribosomal subunit protein mS33 n=1 Tax=Ascobolus immersus RN42 TaxID=1160509 RepID=A0A3N4HZ91_ASCIM|nr:hypothetical protein BJ508DRAFT_363357 [Ascobolus immersus RN42]
MARASEKLAASTKPTSSPIQPHRELTTMLGPPARSRLLELAKTSCAVFSTTFNPTCKRTGNKILRQRLNGASIADYYLPRSRIITIPDMRRRWNQYVQTKEAKALGIDPEEYEFVDEDEMRRLEAVEYKKSRGKGAPKKKKEKVVERGKKRK